MDRYVLIFGDPRLGIYEPKTETYREYESDGKSLGKAKPFPWKKKEEAVTEK